MSHLEWRSAKFTEEEVETLDEIIVNICSCSSTAQRSETELNYDCSDSYDIFKVSVEKEQNQYGVVRYIVTVTVASTDEEIHTPESLAQHDKYPDIDEVKETLKENGVNVDEIVEKVKTEFPKREGYIGTLDDAIAEALYDRFSEILNRNFEKEVKEYESKKSVTVPWGTSDVTVSRKVVESWCPLNIPHYHYYKGHVLTLVTQEIHKILDFLNMIDLIVNLYESE